jgi:transcription elongation factor GreA
MSDPTTTKWLPKAAYDRLTAELEELSGPRREEVVARIAEARDEGDLKENGGYHAAREEQGKIEARIRELTLLLRHAEVGEAAATDQIAVGNIVTASVAGNEMRFLLGSREIAGDSDIDVYSEGSPLGRAVLGAKVGSTLTYTAPNGRAIEVQVEKVEPYAG